MIAKVHRFRSRFLSTCAALGVLGLMAGGSAAQAQRVTTDQMKRSVWNTTYVAANGQRVRATLVFQGGSGYYRTSGGTGRLSNIQYRFDTGGGGNYPWAGLIEGDWSFLGSSGRFSFSSQSANLRLSGSWDYGDGQGGGGEWNGTFSSLMGSNSGGSSGSSSGGSSSGSSSGGSSSSGGVSYGAWKQTERGNYYRVCYLPRGGYQYLILFPDKPQWVYWYNPTSQVYWCCCPTIRHSRYGDDIAGGADLFLMATKKSSDIRETEFPENVSPNFKSGATVKDRDGSTVSVDCPPASLPPGI